MAQDAAGIVIIGGGQAAASMAAKLRTLGYVGAVTIVGDEPVPPYQRPPLSKAYLLGQMPVERLTLRGDEWWAAQGITLRLGVRVEAIDRAGHHLRLSDGTDLAYEQVALCTGAVPRHLPASVGGNLAGVYTVRNLADVRAMQPEFQPGRRLVVIGGGYIGLEAAAVASKLGLQVTLVEAAARILGRVAAAETANAMRALHQGHGVKIIEGTGLKTLIARADGRVSGAELIDGRQIDADFVIVGIGVTPETGLAQAAGLAVANGILVDALGRTNDPLIWAAGDCAAFPAGSTTLRLESVGNAIDMAECVAQNMVGGAQIYVPKPWFWSDQFDAKLQIAGLGTGYTQVVTRADGLGRSFWYFKDGQLIAVDALNDPRAYMVGKRLIENGQDVSPTRVETATDLKGLLA